MAMFGGGPEVSIVIKAIDKFSQTMTNFEKKLGITKAQIGITGAAITGFGIAGGALLVNTGLLAARVETLGIVMEQVGKVSGVSNDELDKQEEIIKNLGITTKEAKETLILFMQGQLDVADASKIARTAQDLAVIAGTNSSEATKTLTRAILSQQPELLKQFGIVQNLDSVYLKYARELDLITEKVDKNGKTSKSWSRELTDVEKRQAFLNVILEEGEKVAGTYEAAMGTAGKQLTSLPRHIDEARLAFGKAFIPVISLAVQTLTKLLQWYNNLSPATQKFVSYAVIAGTALALIIGPALVLVAILPAIAAGLGIVATLFGLITWPVIAVIAGIAALIAIGVLLYKHWDWIKEKASEVWERIKDVWENIKAKTIDVVDSVMKSLTAFWEKWKSVISFISGLIVGLFLPKLAIMGTAAIINIAKVTGAWIVMATKATWAMTVTTVKAIPGIIISFGKMAIAAVVSIAKVIGAWVIMGIKSLIAAGKMALAWIIAMGPIAWVSALVVGLVALIIANWDWVKETTIKVWESISEFFIGLWDKIKEIFWAAWEWIKEMFMTYHPIGLVITHWETIKEFFTGLWERVKEIFLVTWEWIKNMFLNYTAVGLVIKHWDKLKEFFANLWEGIKDTFKKGVNFLIGLAEGLSNAWIRGINNIASALEKVLQIRVPSWVPGLGGKSWGLSLPRVPEISIPRLAEGGIVTRPTTALIGEAGPEAIVPLNKGFGTTFNIYIEGNNIYGTDPDEIAEALNNKLRTMISI